MYGRIWPRGLRQLHLNKPVSPIDMHPIVLIYIIFWPLIPLGALLEYLESKGIYPKDH